MLDQLKRNSLTRHIPVHVVSVADYAHEALELGAIGYALKPVKREQLVEAFHKLDAKLSQGMRHVLVVEDDARQRESIRLLLARPRRGDHRRAHRRPRRSPSCRRRTFDCMVMDLNLPDLSGYELLERMAEQGDVAFPPVIVYTGRSLTRDEEQRLRRFSRSIIIKDARSPERLLDEVTLFLHQVESDLPEERQRMLKTARARESSFEGRRILVVEDDARNIFALASIFEPKGAEVAIARNGREALQALERGQHERQRGRPRADGHHDAGDGRADRDARDPQASRVAQAADHRPDRQGDEGRPGEVPRGRRQRLHRQAARRGKAAVAHAGVDAEVRPAAPRAMSQGLT